MTRTQELREAIVGWLEGSTAVQEYLGADGSIVPAAVARDDGSSPQIAFAVSLLSVSRQNDQRTVELRARVVTSGTYEWVARTDGAIDELGRLHDAVGDTLTTSRDGWTANGVRTDEEIAPNDAVNRYLGATSYSFERTETHPYYH